MNLPSPENLGLKRIPDNQPFRKQILDNSQIRLSELVGLLPSNYPKASTTNIAVLYRAISDELARLRLSGSLIGSDSVYTTTRIEYLQQILGDRLFLFGREVPPAYNDESFRNYLISIKNAYFKGSRKSNIEQVASEFTGLTVKLNELYLKAREPNSPYGVTDTNMMVFDVFIDGLAQNANIATLENDLKFFADLIKPAHVLYDTRFIWTDQIDTNKIHDLIFGDTGGGCVPIYDYIPFDEPTYLAQQIFVVSSPLEATGRIDTIHHHDSIIYLEDGSKFIVAPGVDGTAIYDITGHRISLDTLEIGQYVKIYSLVIPGDFQFWWLSPYVSSVWSSRFYKDIIRRPVFQEYVKKIMDSKGRFPLQIKTTPSTICDRWVQDLMDVQYEDTRKFCGAYDQTNQTYSVTLAEHFKYPKFSWPWPHNQIHSETLFGNDFEFTMPLKPLTDGSGSPATPSNISVFIDSTSLPNSVSSVDASAGSIRLTDSTTFWEVNRGHIPVPGNTLKFDYAYRSGGTDTSTSSSFIWGVSHWQMPSIPLVTTDSSLATPSDIGLTVDNTSISNAVLSVEPLLGHVTVNDSSSFWALTLGRLPVIGDEFKFTYNLGRNETYTMLFDDPGRTGDGYQGHSSRYTIVLDGFDSTNAPITRFTPATIGYKYRVYLLHHSSVLNSPDTLRLNHFQKPQKRASLINQQSALNHLNLIFSAEFLHDPDPVKELNDDYITKELPTAVVQLREGTPPFQKTFAYHPGLVYHRKLLDIRQHRHPLIYSDLLLKEFHEGDSVPLTSICDNYSPVFKIRIGEQLNRLKECPQWMLYDTVFTETVQLDLPANHHGVANLRVASKKLRQNFILRELESEGIVTRSYSTVATNGQQTFQMPIEWPYTLPSHEVVYYTGLPILKDKSTLAGVGDVDVKINDILVPGAIQSINPLTGSIILNNPLSYIFMTEYIQLTQTDIDNKFVSLSETILDTSTIGLTIIKGTSQFIDTDFYIEDGYLGWYFTPLQSLLAVGDILRVQYGALVRVEFTYHISSTPTIEIIDEYRSRIPDNDHVLASPCPDPIKSKITGRFYEYTNTLDDCSYGIKQVYFNKDTYQIEEYVFTGPVFELYTATDDEIGSPDSFANALVKVHNPTQHGNPLTSMGSYGFMNDPIVRFRRKTIKELLPDRSFRNFEIIEMLSL